MPTTYHRRHWSEGIQCKGNDDASKCVRWTIENTTSYRGQFQHIDHHRLLRRKSRVKTVRGGEAGLRKHWNKELTTTRVQIDRTHLPKTHKLGIDIRSPKTVNSLRIPPSYLWTSTKSNKMSKDHFRSTFAHGFSSHTTLSTAGRASHLSYSTNTRPVANTSPTDVHNQRKIIQSMVLTIEKESRIHHPQAKWILQTSEEQMLVC